MATHTIDVERAMPRPATQPCGGPGKRTGRTRRIDFAVCAAACALLCAPEAGIGAGDASALAVKYNCQTCHALDKKVLGPSYKDIAAKYAGDAGAPDKLQKKVKTGGSGVWGSMPMPPNNVPDEDRTALVEWILGIK